MHADDITTWSPPGEGERWLIELTYPDEYRKVVLGRLTLIHVSDQCTLLIQGQRLLLASTRFEGCLNGNQVWHVSLHLLHVVNAIGHDGRYHLIPPLQRTHVFVERAGHLERWRLSPEIHSGGISAGGAEYRPLSSPLIVGLLLDLQTTDREVQAAFELWDKISITWTDMYKMHEIIEKSAGPALAELESAAYPQRVGERSARTMFRALLQCAQHHEEVGINAARHYSATERPKISIHRMTAKSMMDSLFREWLLHRVKQTLVSEVRTALSALRDDRQLLDEGHEPRGGES